MWLQAGGDLTEEAAVNLLVQALREQADEEEQSDEEVESDVDVSSDVPSDLQARARDVLQELVEDGCVHREGGGEG